MRVLGVDLGQKRIGIAVGDSLTLLASARASVTAGGGLKRDSEKVAAVATREEADAIVVGEPANEADDRMARVCRMFAQHLRDLGWTVHLVDESLTSVGAEAAMSGSGLRASQRKARRDGEAACQILERFFHAQN